MRLVVLLITLLGFSCPAAEVKAVVAALMDKDAALKEAPFSEVVFAATGKRVIALNPTNTVDRELISKLARALDAVLHKLNGDGAAHTKRRINEVSALFEAAMKTELNAVEGFECEIPKNASGARQRSGYPDLQLKDRKSGRVLYLDPKLFESGSRASSLRTFYYEPKRATNKVLEDAHHLIVGFEHNGQTGAWKFLGWELVDLANFRVRLKAEFQASNRDLYQPQAVVAKSTNATAEAQGRKD